MNIRCEQLIYSFYISCPVSKLHAPYYVTVSQKVHHPIKKYENSEGLFTHVQHKTLRSIIINKGIHYKAWQKLIDGHVAGIIINNFELFLQTF